MIKLEMELRTRFAARVQTRRPLADLTSFKIGGPADLYLAVEDIDELAAVMAAAHRHDVPAFCLGSGTNLLISDRGIRGLVVRLGAGFAGLAIEGCEVRAGAAMQFGKLAAATVARGLAGLEFGEGIPGSVGGGLMMNAGAFGGEMARVVTAIHGVTDGGHPRILTKDEAGFAYRRTALPLHFVITQVAFRLAAGDRDELQARVNEIHARRISRQPNGVPNAGSVFKNPPGGFAGKLLEAAGLKGARQGAAAFSDRHANFIVNLGGASARDVQTLIDLARARVQSSSGVMLEPEVRLVGDW